MITHAHTHDLSKYLKVKTDFTLNFSFVSSLSHHAFALKPIKIICRPVRSGLIVSLFFPVSPSVSLEHTSSVCAIEAVHHWQQRAHTHSQTNTRFPSFAAQLLPYIHVIL